VSGDLQRHIVVFDVNVYLDVADLLGPPFSWEAFGAAAARTRTEPLPCRDVRVDSLRAIAMCTSGKFAGDEPLEVWTNAHIEGLVRRKAMHPLTPQPGSNKRGLGWSQTHAAELVGSLVEGLLEQSNGGSLGGFRQYPDGNPPLDHEDGMVYGACRKLSGDDPLARVYCVTRDSGFLEAYTSGMLPNHSRVLTPAQMAALMRAARSHISIRRMLPGDT